MYDKENSDDFEGCEQMDPAKPDSEYETRHGNKRALVFFSSYTSQARFERSRI